VALPYPIEQSTQLTLYQGGGKCSVYKSTYVVLLY
jgi:hypothetical protein